MIYNPNEVIVIAEGTGAYNEPDGFYLNFFPAGLETREIERKSYWQLFRPPGAMPIINGRVRLGEYITKPEDLVIFCSYKFDGWRNHLNRVVVRIHYGEKRSFVDCPLGSTIEDAFALVQKDFRIPEETIIQIERPKSHPPCFSTDLETRLLTGDVLVFSDPAPPPPGIYDKPLFY